MSEPESELFEQPGAFIGRYRLEEVLGEGGFGVVYRAQQLRPVQREVAFKIVKVGMDTKKLLARFDAERQALAVMEHPGIAKVLDADATDNGRPYFVMELVRGPHITDWCDDHNLPVSERLGLFKQVCEAVQHAHQKGVLHRDIKPSNVLVTEENGVPAPKVIDFGLARATEPSRTDNTLLTEIGQVMGTPTYMSPEQAAGRVDEIDTRTDVYSLGVLLYELLTGTVPFEWERLDAADFLMAQRILLHEEPRRPSTRITKTGDEATTAASQRGLIPTALRKRLKGDLDWIVMRALEKDPDRRYGSAHELAADVERHLRHEPVLAGPPGTAYQLRKLVRRHRGLFAAAAVVFIALVMGAVGTTLGLLREQAANVKLEDALGKVKAQSAELEQRAIELAKERDRAKEAERVAADERDRTKENLALLQETHDFLNHDLLSSVGADFQGHDVTVRQVLDRASFTANLRFLGRPRLEAEMRGTLARSYQQLGLFEKARIEAERTEKLYEKLGDTQLRTERMLHARAIKAQQLESLGRFEEAEELLLELIAEAEQTLPDTGKELVALRDDLAGVLDGLGRQEEAVALYRRVLDDARRSKDLPPQGVPTTLNNFGQLLGDMGQYLEARAMLEEAIELGTRRVGRRHSIVLTARGNLALVLRNMGEVDLAEEMAEEALVAKREALGDDHPTVALAMNTVGQLRADRGLVEEAAALYEDAYGILRAALGEEHKETLVAANNLASAWTAMQWYDRSLPLREKTLAAQRSVLGPEHPNTLTGMNNLAVLYRDLERYDEALALYEETLEIERRVLGDDHPSTIITLENLGGVYYACEQYAKSLPILEEVLEARRRVLGDAHPDVAKTLYNIALHHKALGRREQAREMFEDVERRYRGIYGVVHPERASAIRRLADMDWDDGDLASAEEAYWEVQEIHEKLLPKGHPTHSFLLHQLAVLTLNQKRPDEAFDLITEAVALRRNEADRSALCVSLYVFAAVLRKQGKNREAVAPLLESAEGWLELEAVDHPNTQRAIEQLVRLYEKLHEDEPDAGWGEKAAAWREKLS